MIEREEAKEIAISVVAISLALAIVFAGLDGLFLFPKEFLFFVFSLLVTIGSGFILHEMGHKLVAISYGAYARFKMWAQGIVFMFLTSVLGFLFAAPGAVYIFSPSISKKENAIISLVGPLINVLLAIFFLIMQALLPLKQFYSFLIFYGGGFAGYGIYRGIFDVWQFGAAINLILAMFNMIPIFPLDGSKVYAWNRFLWVASILFLLAFANAVIGFQATVSFALMFFIAFILSKLFFG